MIFSWVANLSESDAESWSGIFTAVAIIAGIALALGLVGEYPESKWWKKSCLYKLAKIAVILGVSIELIGDAGIFETSARLQKLTDDSILANVKVEKAMLEQLKARGFSKDQFNDLVDGLRGKFSEISVWTLTDAEAYLFATAIMEAFQKADVKVNWMRPTVPLEEFFVEGVPSTGIHLMVSQDTPGFKEMEESFLKVSIKAGVTGLSGGTPKTMPSGVPSPSLFVAKHDVPFMQFPEYDFPSERFPSPPWEPKSP